MRFNIISVIDNGVGLQAHYQILKALLESRGHSVAGVHLRRPRAQRADINLFLEIIQPKLFPLAPKNWVIVHPEWWYADWTASLPRFDRVFCLTHDAERIFRPLAGDKVRYIGFKSKDRLMPKIVKERAFIHVAGRSEGKNTQAVMDAWRLGQLPYPLLLISHKYVLNSAKVRSRPRLSEPELAVEMNRRMFHLCPSAYEGFGHYSHEAMGVKGVIITTNRAPMNEIGCVPPELLVEPSASPTQHYAPFFTVGWQEIARAAKAAWELPREKVAEIQAQTRSGFEAGRAEFEKLFMAEVNELAPRQVGVP
jgi:hypothetical protein